MTNTTAPAHRGPGRPTDPISPDALRLAARKAFAEQGYAATSLSSIASRVGIRKASLLHHFRTKDSLYVAVIDELIAELYRLVLNAQLGEASFVERLDRLGELVVNYLGQNPAAAKLVVHELMGSGRYLRVKGSEAVQGTLATTTAFLEAGMTAGEFTRQDPKQLGG